ncbi:hypothetical protein I6A84_01210 [Frankia sp. CNm7]|uniref:Uncharacterized protein n=1 Tax=Frankia nepalensis TaxID=1836974 RepID=A0A937RE24_9ACTN|nr:hypothetical protein [Frankia nepalensis]MBL7496124.1 hypothetical protein [Frankia nepalensis]MBL7508937.1 hypothetical protein [Frankia nepalensis]MBL7516777.1 hypothetical protein [Frankia nepalensis]MBL7628715.1 hypothetical protein [Frankia nepalensis]
MTEILPEVPAGDSKVQRDAETEAVALLSAKVGVPLAPTHVVLADGSWVEIDAANLDERVIAEVWAHQGPPKGAQRNKVLTDALKLVYVEAERGGQWRKILCFTDEQARDAFTRRSWYAGALRHYGIELEVIELPAQTRAAIREAQKRQYR